MSGYLSRQAVIGLLLALTAVPAVRAEQPPVTGPANGQTYGVAFFPGAEYRPAVPTPESILGFATGDRALTPDEITRCLRAWDKASARAKLVEYAHTHEGRPLFYMILTSPPNMRRLETIQADWSRLANPHRDPVGGERPAPAREGAAADEATVASIQSAGGSPPEVPADLPAVAWLGYSIHGDETSGSNAAISVIYHLCAATDREVANLLNELVVIIDPQMNPDGRARALRQLEELRGHVPNADHESLLHTGYWPSGRTNHYFFDLNRDWILGVHPETRGRLKAIASWNPLLLVDAHEMWSLNTYLFSPAREPLNRGQSARLKKWSRVFAQDQAHAFDRFGWQYYNGEWNEDWYPGYSTTWASCRGAVGILYEQASIDDYGVERPEGRLMTYGESVHHQIVSTTANLRTLKKHRHKLAREFVEERRRAVGGKGSHAKRVFAILPTRNKARLRALVELMDLHGIEVYCATEEFSAARATDPFGRVSNDRRLSPGTLLIPNRQPVARLVSALFDPDPRMSPKALKAELRELLRYDRSTLYDVTAWNLPMMYGLDSLTLTTDLPAGAMPLTLGHGHHNDGDEPDRRVTRWLHHKSRTSTKKSRSPRAGEADAPTAYAIDGADDASVTVAAQLMAVGVKVRIADRATRYEGHRFARGSLFITRADDTDFADRLGATVSRVAARFALPVVGVHTGLGPGNRVDLGGRHLRLLEPPRIALVSREGISAYDLGSIWFTLDQRIGIKSSQLGYRSLTGKDLRGYNVLVLPDGHAGDLPSDVAAKVAEWVRNGGTLIAIGGSARGIARESSKLGSVRTLPDCLNELNQYEQVVLREWMGKRAVPDLRRVYSRVLDPELKGPWDAFPCKRADLEQLKRRDAWQRLFMPQGAIVAGRVDDEHWLTFGTPEVLPILFGKHPVLMTRGPIEAPIRLGLFVPAAAGKRPEKKDTRKGPKEKSEKNGKVPVRIGWASLPAGHEMRLRMSGLLWPEAAHRLANAAWVTREKIGNGQVILFASPPDFRASTLGTSRILRNALVFGPGLGAKHPIR